MASTYISSEESVFNIDDDLIETPGKDLWQRKADFHGTTHSPPPVITIGSYYHIDLPKEPSIIVMAHFNKRSKIPI